MYNKMSPFQESTYGYRGYVDVYCFSPRVKVKASTSIFQGLDYVGNFT